MFLAPYGYKQEKALVKVPFPFQFSVPDPVFRSRPRYRIFAQGTRWVSPFKVT